MMMRSLLVTLLVAILACGTAKADPPLAAGAPIPNSQRGAANGVAPLGPGQTVPVVNLPPISELMGFVDPTNASNLASGTVPVARLPALTTSTIGEGANLYFTNVRAAAAAPVQSVAGLAGAPTVAQMAAALGGTDGLHLAFGNDPRLVGALQRSGDTMTGPLVLSGAPTLALHPATKAYVDTETTRAQGAEATNANAAAAAQTTANAAPTIGTQTGNARDAAAAIAAESGALSQANTAQSTGTAAQATATATANQVAASQSNVVNRGYTQSTQVTAHVFVVTLVNVYGGATCQVSAHGLVSGVGYGTSTAEILIGSNGGTAVSYSAYAANNQTGTGSPGSFYAFATTTSGLVLTINVVFTPANTAGSNLSSEINCQGVYYTLAQTS